MASVSANNVTNPEAVSSLTDSMDKLGVKGGNQPNEV